MFRRFATRETSRSGPSALFALIEAPRRAYFTGVLARNPVGYSLLFTLTLLVLAQAFVFSQINAPLNDATVDILPSEGTIILLIGVVVFPLRMLFVPILAYVLVCFIAFILKYNLEPGFLQAGMTGWGVAAGLLLNAAVAIIAALFGRLALGLTGRMNRWADAILSAATSILYLILSFATIWFVTRYVYPPEWMNRDFGLVDLTTVGWLRASRIGLCSGVLLLALLDVPTRQAFRQAMMVQPLYVLAAVAAYFGYSLFPTLDVGLLTLVVALILPGFSAILAAIFGLTIYISATGAGLVQTPLVTADVVRLEAVSQIVLLINYCLLLFKHQASVDVERDRATLIRVQRVHDFANIGYFVFDVNRALVQVDEVSAAILGTGSSFDAVSFLERVRPADRALVAKTMSERREDATSIAFSLSLGPVWLDGAPDQKHVAIYSWYERLWDGRVIAYGALLDRTEEHNRATALGQALADLSEQQNRQTQLFSIVSHEIRTPASVISMLVEEMDGGASWAKMGPRLKAVSEQLLSVLADMRQTVRPEENLPIRLESFRPQELAETVRNTFLLMAEARGVDLVLSLSESASEERISDRVRLNQVLSNLIKNALVHADCHRITLSYDEETADGQLYALWRVSDDGRGIPPEERGRLFLPFSRITGTGHAHSDGSGLGLYVTKTSIELLGGSVVYREATPHGSEFVLRVPEAPGIAPAAPPKLDPRTVARDFRKALVVEDSDLIGELLVARLQRLVPAVIWARSGLEGLELAANEAPDLILTDLFTPKMGGDEMTAQLRAQGMTIPIIGMTAAAIGDERTKFEHAGTNFVLTKPVSTAQLVEALARLTGKPA